MNDARTALLDTALERFVERGYESTGIQEIVDRAGVSKPTLYHHFGCKEGLLLALLAESLEPFQSRLESAANHQDDLPLALNRVTRAFFDFAGQSPQFYRLVICLASAPSGSASARAFAPYAARWHAVLKRLFTAASNPRVHSRSAQLAVTFLGVINTWISLALNDAIALDQDLAFQAVHQYMHGIYA